MLGVVQVLFYIAVGLTRECASSRARRDAVLLVFGALVALAFGALGAWLAYRTGSGETIQALFPVLFVFLFISSMNTPRNLIGVHWFRIAATLNPVSYLIECVRSLIITGWDWQALALGFGFVDHPRRRRRSCSPRVRSANADGADVRIRPGTSCGVAWRTLKNALTTPQILLPSLLFPLFFFTAFAGGLSQVCDVPGFDYPPGYTAFQFVFVLLQSAAFSGVFTGLRRRARLRGGFAKRLMLAAPRRSGIVLGYALRGARPLVDRRGVLTVIALIVGMNIGGGACRSRRAVPARRAREHLPASSGRAGSPCGCARSRPGRSCRCRSSSSSSSRPSTCRWSCSRAGSTALRRVNP